VKLKCFVNHKLLVKMVVHVLTLLISLLMHVLVHPHTPELIVKLKFHAKFHQPLVTKPLLKDHVLTLKIFQLTLVPVHPVTLALNVRLLSRVLPIHVSTTETASMLTICLTIPVYVKKNSLEPTAKLQSHALLNHV
jgi:hypothetical protein